MIHPTGRIKIISCYSMTKAIDKEHYESEVTKFVNSLKGKTIAGIVITWLCPDAQTMHCVVEWAI